MKHLFFQQKRNSFAARPTRSDRRLAKRQFTKAIKRLPVLLALLAAAPAAQAQTQGPAWQAASSLNQAGIGGVTYGQRSVVDASGNTFVLGSYSGTVVIGNTTLVSQGSQDVFVAKLDANGNWLWAQTAGGAYSEQALGLTLDASGNLLVTGSTSGTPQFGSFTLSLTGTHTFVAKLSAAGTWLWAKSATGTGTDTGTAVTTDASGNIIVTGYAGGTSTFGTTTLTGIGNSYDLFVTKLDASGNWLWAKNAGGTSADQGSAVTTDASGNIFLTGFFSATASFGSNSLTSAGGYDVFVAKLDANGNWGWVKGAGGGGNDQGNGLGLDASGNLFAISTYASSGTYGSTSLTSAGGNDLAVSKLSASGNWLWTQSAGGAGTDTGNDLAVDSNGNVLLVASFNGSNISFGSTALTGSTSTNFAVAKLNSNGTWDWAKVAAGTGRSIALDGAGGAVVTGTVQSSSTIGTTTVVGNNSNSALFVAKVTPTAWPWVAQSNIGSSSNIISTAVDARGNTFVAGYFTGIASFGATTLSSVGSSDLFIAKLDAAGNWLWAKQGGGVNFDQATGITLDASGNVLLTGYFYGAASFGSNNLTSAGSYDALVAKLDANGNWLWAKQGGGVNYDQGSGISTDAQGNILVIGNFYAATSLGTNNLTSAGGNDVFISKLDANGNWLWAKSAGSTDYDQGMTVGADASGNVLIGGTFYKTGTFGPISLTSAGAGDAFVAKLDASGNWLWARQAGGTSADQTLNLTVDASGNVLATGVFYNTASFGNSSLTGSGGDAFIAKLDGGGNWLWVKQAGGAGSDQGTDITTDANGNAFVTGYFANTASFGTSSLTSVGGYDAFVAKFDPSGNWQWVKQGGGAGSDQPTGIGLDASGGAVIAGYFGTSNGTAPISATYDGTTIAGAASGNTGFVAELTSPLAITSFTPTNGSAGTSVVLTGRGFTSVSSVSFNGTAAPGFVVNSTTQITVNVPSGATTGLISVVTADGTATSTQPFTVLGDLVVSTAQAISGTYRNVTVMGSGVATLTNSLNVTGTLTVQSGGALNTKTYAVTGNSFVLSPGGTLSIGSSAGIAATGSTGSIQTTTRTFATDANYVYGSAVAGSETGSGLPAQVRSLSVLDLSGSATANVKLTNDLAVAQTLRLDYDLTTNGKNLTLLSTPLAGSALVYNNGGAVQGTATVQRAIDPTLNSGLGYRQFSAPVSNTTVADLATTGFVPTVNPAYNTSATPTAETPFPTVYGYDQSRLTLANNLMGFDKGWASPAALSDALVAGQGYTVNLPASELVDFVGTLNNNNIIVNLSRTSGATAADGGWQLLGNPYPSPLDLSQVAATDRVNLDAAVYVSQSLSQYTGQYRAYVNNLSTSSSNSPVLPSGQGFFVRVSAGQTSGSFTFRNSQRVTTFDASTSMQRSAADTRPQVHLALRGTSSVSDAAIVYFENGATDGFDGQYDAAKLPNTTGLNLSTALAGGSALAIDGRAVPTASLTIPLNVYVPTTGTYTLAADQLLNLSGLRPYLRDTQLGTLTDLTQQPSYSFSQNAAFVGARFELVFTPAQPLATIAATSAQVAVYPNPAQAVAYVELPAALGAQPVAATLIDALGRTVHTATLPAQGAQAHQLSLAGLPSGVYALRLHTSAGVVAKRLVIE